MGGNFRSSFVRASQVITWRGARGPWASGLAGLACQHTLFDPHKWQNWGLGQYEPGCWMNCKTPNLTLGGMLQLIPFKRSGKTDKNHSISCTILKISLATCSGLKVTCEDNLCRVIKLISCGIITIIHSSIKIQVLTGLRHMKACSQRFLNLFKHCIEHLHSAWSCPQCLRLNR